MARDLADIELPEGVKKRNGFMNLRHIADRWEHYRGPAHHTLFQQIRSRDIAIRKLAQQHERLQSELRRLAARDHDGGGDDA